MHIDGIKILSDEDIKEALRRKFQRAVEELKLSEKAIEKFEETVHEDVELIKKGRKPAGTTAARIYIISLLIGERRGQREIAWKLGTCEGTVRKIYHQLTGRNAYAHYTKQHGKNVQSLQMY